MLGLENVTLICVSGIKINQSLYALWKSSLQIKFSEVKFVSSAQPKYVPDGIKFEKALNSRLNSIDEYNDYCIFKLHNHVTTEFALLIQYDGFILNPDSWDQNFLNFDYIGAPWPIRDSNYIDPFGNNQRVGNGGFSLRSRKLMTVPLRDYVNWSINQNNFYKHFNYNSYSEDILICVHNRHVYERNDCTFAPLELACKFSFEQKIKDCIVNKPFGFHRNWPNLLYFVKDLFHKILFYIKIFQTRI